MRRPHDTGKARRVYHHQEDHHQEDHHHEEDSYDQIQFLIMIRSNSTFKANDHFHVHVLFRANSFCKAVSVVEIPQLRVCVALEPTHFGVKYKTLRRRSNQDENLDLIDSLANLSIISISDHAKLLVKLQRKKIYPLSKIAHLHQFAIAS